MQHGSNKDSPQAQALAAEMLQRLQRGQDVRAAKVARVQQAIAASTYENALKLEVAVERLMQSEGMDAPGAVRKAIIRSTPH